MTPNRTIIKYYQLIGEGLLFYFLIVPITEIFEYSIPLWGYLFMVAVSITFLSIGIRYIANYSIYLVSLFILIPIAIYVGHFPPISASVFALFMTWRFIMHDANPDQRNQMQLITYMSLAFLFDVIFFYDMDIVWIALIMLVVMIGGYQLSHVVVDGSIGVKQSIPFVVSFFAIIFAGSVVVFSTYRIVTTVVPYVYSFLTKTIGSGLWWGLELVGFTGLDIESLQKKLEGMAVQGNNETKLNDDVPRFLTEEEMNTEYTPPDVINWWTIGIAAFILILIIILLSRMKLRNQGKDKELERVPSETIQGEINKTPLFSKWNSEQPDDEVRRKVFHFERAAVENGIGRKQSETIEEWFRRLGINGSNLDLYQKIRYGNSRLTKDEIQVVKSELEEMRSQLNI